MVKAIWHGTVIAESDAPWWSRVTYFPRDAVDDRYLTDSDMYSTCPWKGQASYFSLEVNGLGNADSAWYYPYPKKRALPINDRIAFWRGVTIEE